MRDRIREVWRQMRLARWATSPAGLSYHEALDDVWDALESENPCHDRVREWIVRRREQLAPQPRKHRTPPLPPEQRPE